ncbi:uncharacterized protein [Antedon mediterranea]|uniref:uncharacterized protein n=1 Tax=Antedon mediterranea TaxID=105859 RepID=UPI003AF9B322
MAEKESVYNCIRLGLLIVAFSSGITVIGTMTALESKFNSCIILSDVVWDDPKYQCEDANGEKKEHCVMVLDTPSTCFFIVKYEYWACSISVIWFVYTIIRLSREYEYSRGVYVLGMTSIIYCLLSLASACILLAAYHKLCNGLLKVELPSHPTCKDFEAPGIWQADVDNLGISFIPLLRTAQAMSWISCMSWLGLFMIYLADIFSLDILPERFVDDY